MTESELQHEYDRAQSEMLRLRGELEAKRQKRQTEMQMQRPPTGLRPPEIDRQYEEYERTQQANGTAEVSDCPVAAPAELAPPVILAPAALCLDLGSGPRPAPGFKGVDIVEGITDFTFDLCEGNKWPWADGSVEQFRASHWIEHIRADYIKAYNLTMQDAFFFVFDEAYRCAKPGATFQLIWPALKNARAFQDPTHRRFIPGETMLYLDAKQRELNGLTHYNVRCDWVCEAISPTIPDVEAEAHQGEVGAKILMRRLAREWNLEQDTTATLRARK